MDAGALPGAGGRGHTGDFLETPLPQVRIHLKAYVWTPALVLLFGLGLLIFFVANAWPLGRRFFLLAARRFHSVEEAKRLRNAHRSAVMSIPILNLATPLFGTAMMVHMHKRLMGSRRVRPVTDGNTLQVAARGDMTHTAAAGSTALVGGLVIAAKANATSRVSASDARRSAVVSPRRSIPHQDDGGMRTRERAVPLRP